MLISACQRDQTLHFGFIVNVYLMKHFLKEQELIIYLMRVLELKIIISAEKICNLLGFVILGADICIQYNDCALCNTYEVTKTSCIVYMRKKIVYCVLHYKFKMSV